LRERVSLTIVLSEWNFHFPGRFSRTTQYKVSWKSARWESIYSLGRRKGRMKDKETRWS